MAYNVLVVDDSAVTRKVVKRAISMSGLDLGAIHEAPDGQEALALLDSEWIDIVFTDLNMPKMGGVELVGHIMDSEAHRKTPVVVITSSRNEERLESLMARGIKAWIKKPFRPEAVREVVGKLMGELRGGV